MFKKPTEENMKEIVVSKEWFINRLNLTPTEEKVFLIAYTNFSNKPFIPRDIAAAGYAASTAIYTSLYNKNVFNKNEDKTWSLNVPFINKIGEEYRALHEPKGHSLILHIIFGWILLYIPSIYYLFSKRHYYHF